MLAQSMTESEVAQKLGIDQSTISRDVKALKELSQRFVYDLAKSDLAYCYKECIDGVEEVKKKAWFMLNNELQNPKRQAFSFEADRNVMKPSLHYLRMVHPL